MDEKEAGWTTNSMVDLNFMASQGSQILNTMELLGIGIKNPLQAR